MANVDTKQWRSHFDVLSRYIPLLRRWSGEQTQQLIGLDISTDSIKLLKINTAVTPNVIEDFAILPTPTGAFLRDEIKGITEIARFLKDEFQARNINIKNVALAIPRSQAIIKNIIINNRFTDKELESRAWIEASRHFPDLVGDIYLDFAVIETTINNTEQIELVLVACRKAQIDPYLEIMNQAGLVPKIIDVSCYALERALNQSLAPIPTQETIALLNLNTNVSSLIVMHKGVLVHAHDQSYDGRRLKTQINQYVKNNKEKVVSLDDAAYRAILNENMVSHLRHTMHLFYSSRPNISIDRIVIAGDCASIPELPAFISQELGIVTELANPFKKMTVAKKINAEELKATAPELMLCCGLSLSEVRG